MPSRSHRASRRQRSSNVRDQGQVSGSSRRRRGRRGRAGARFFGQGHGKEPSSGHGHRRHHELAPAPISVPARGPRGGDRGRVVRHRREERDHQR